MFLTVGNIYISTEHKISSPPCTSGETQQLVEIRIDTTLVSLSRTNFAAREFSSGKCPTVAPTSWSMSLITKNQTDYLFHEHNLRIATLLVANIFYNTGTPAQLKHTLTVWIFLDLKNLWTSNSKIWTKKKKHKMIITNSILITTLLPIISLANYTVVHFLNVRREDLQSEMYIIWIVYIRAITLIALLLMDFELLYNINKYFFERNNSSRK